MNGIPEKSLILSIILILFYNLKCSDFGIRLATPLISVSPPSISFPCINFGNQEEDFLTIKNEGNSTLHIYSIYFEKGYDSPFSVDIDSFSIKPETSITLTIRYTPTWEEVVSDNLVIENNCPDMEKVIIPVDGCGLLPILEVSPSTLEFNGVRLGESSDPSTVSLISSGSGTIIIYDISIEGSNPDSFRFESTEVTPFPIDLGEVAYIETRFIPLARSPQLADLIIESNDPTTSRHKVDLYGNIDCEASISGEIVWKGSDFYPHIGEPIDDNGIYWFEEGFDDSDWEIVSLPEAGTIPSGYDRFYRGKVYFTEIIGSHLLTPYSDDGIYLYVNGNFIGNWGGERGHIGCVNRDLYCGDNEEVDPQNITQYLHYDYNIISALVSNPHEDSYFDLGWYCDPPSY